MAKVTYVLKDGTRRHVDAGAGSSVMETALKHNLQGIAAECGGGLSCATCHVYVDDLWLAKLPAPEIDEIQMLEFVAAKRRPASRLSCQIVLSEALDGLVVHIPATQIAD